MAVYPSVIDAPPGTAAQGTTLLSTVDHGLDHRTLGSAIIAVENKLGIGAGSANTNFLLVGTALGTTSWQQTWNNGSLGTPSLILGSDTTGDMFVRSAGGTVTRIAAGSVDTVLTGQGIGTAPVYKAVSNVNNYVGTELDNITYTTTSTSYVSIDGTNFKGTITPTSTNSKIKLTFHATFLNFTGSPTGKFAFIRNPAGTPGTLLAAQLPPAASLPIPLTFVSIDSPATTSPVVYDSQWNTNQGTIAIGNTNTGATFLIEELKS